MKLNKLFYGFILTPAISIAALSCEVSVSNPEDIEKANVEQLKINTQAQHGNEHILME